MSCNEYNKCLGSWYSYASWTNTKLILTELETLNSDEIIKYLTTINENLNTLIENQESCCTKTQRKLNRIIKLINNATSKVEDWEAGIDYQVGDEVMYSGVEYNCIQSHVSQNDWTPDLCPALWGAVVLASDVIISANEVATITSEVSTEVYEVTKNILGKEKVKKVKKK